MKKSEERRESMRKETTFMSTVKVNMTLVLKVPGGSQVAMDDAAEFAEGMAQRFIIKAVENEAQEPSWREGYSVDPGQIKADTREIIGRWTAKPKDPDS